MEGGKGVAEKKGTNEVVVQISGTEETSGAIKETSRGSTSYAFSPNSQLGSSPKGSRESNLELKEVHSLRCRIQMSTFDSGSPEASIARPSPAGSKPPKIPTEPVSRRASLARSAFSKPKSRLVEPPRPTDANLAEEKAQIKSNANSPFAKSPNATSPGNKVAATTPRDNLRSAPITPRTPLIGTPGGEDDDDEEVYKTANLKVSEKSRKKVKVMALMEWFAFVCITAFSIATLTVHRLQHSVKWGLELWKWSVLVFVIICGRLVTEWFINVLVFMFERNFLLKKKVLYFVYGLKKSVQVFIWLGLVLLAWGLLFNRGVKRSRKTTRILNYVTRALASCLIGASIWLAKNLLLKFVSSSFQCTRFFDRIQESIFHQYVLRTLSGPPLMEMAERVGRTASTGQLSFRNLKKERDEGRQGGKEEVIDVDKLHKMKQEKVSAWTMKGLINVVRSSGLSTISTLVDENEDEPMDEQINSEWESKAAAYRIFQNVAKPGSK